MMIPIEKLSATIFMSSIFYLLPFSVFATGIDDITGYQPPALAGSKSEPYTIQDIIYNVSNSLDGDGVYKGRWVDGFNDPKAIAFDEDTFGKCEYFYIRFNGKTGGFVFDWTLRYLFPENETQKFEASKVIKRELAKIESSTNSEYRAKECADWRNYSVKLKMTLNAVIQAAPTILQEKKRLVELEQAAKIQKQNEANERNLVAQKAKEKAAADKQALALAERKGSQERANALMACQATNEYKLYSISTTIEQNQSIAQGASLEMQRQKEGAKISGYVNKQVMYEMGNRVAGANRLNKENFVEYQKLGGAAKKTEAVKASPDPCAQ